MICFKQEIFWSLIEIICRTYALEHSKLCSSMIHHRSTPFPTPDESGTYSKVLGL